MPDTLKKTIFSIIKILLVALGVYILFKIGGFFVPFIIAFIFSSLIEPIVKFIETKLRISRKSEVFSRYWWYSVPSSSFWSANCKACKGNHQCITTALNLTFDSISALY